MVDLTDLPEVSVGNSVVLLGSNEGDDITVEEFANWGEMLPYEVLCGISKRMPRVYVE
jgi:alanine racemase